MDYRAVVIGGGPGGYVAAIRLGQLGQKTLLVDRSEVGGVCLQCGCIPSKALIQAARTYAALRHRAEQMGIQMEGLSIDWAQTIAWKDRIIARLTRGIHQLLKGNGVEFVRGTASIVDPHRVRIVMRDGAREVTAETIVIATGSAPVELPGFPFDGSTIISSTEALQLQHIPDRLVIIGGGYIGLELGMVYAMIGSAVTIVELMDQILPGVSPDIVRVVERRLRRYRVQVLTAARAQDIVTEDDRRLLIVRQGDRTHRIPFDVLLVTVGRRPAAEDLRLDVLGVARDTQGYVRVDAQRRTSVPHIFAIGDIAGAPMLAHKASHEGEIVAEVIAGHNVAVDYTVVPNVIFTDPEIATVGLTEAEARRQGLDVRIGRFPFAALGRALIAQEPEGFVKIIADPESRVVLGVEMVGPEVSSLIAEAALAIEMGATTEDIALTVHAHPTFPEAVMEAAKSVFDRAIHTL